MIRVHRCAFLAILGLVSAIGASRPAAAREPYGKQFKAMYVKEGTPLAAAVDGAKCNVCHVGKSKKDRNAYGQAIAERIEKNTKDADKIKKVLEEVASLSSDPSKPDAPTFGALIAQGTLPGGPAK